LIETLKMAPYAMCCICYALNYDSPVCNIGLTGRYALGYVLDKFAAKTEMAEEGKVDGCRCYETEAEKVLQKDLL